MEQKWMKVENGLPEKSGEYLVYRFNPKSNIRYISTCDFSAKHKAFNCLDFLESPVLVDSFVTHWIELPAVPEVVAPEEVQASATPVKAPDEPANDALVADTEGGIMTALQEALQEAVHNGASLTVTITATPNAAPAGA